jgi:hypothetical protein
VDVPVALACERFGDGFVGQPANAATSLAFVVAGLAVLAGGGASRSGAKRGLPGRGDGRRWTYAGLVVAVGVGSLVQHGPHPAWQAYAHDLPLASLLAFVAADAAADLAACPEPERTVGAGRGGEWGERRRRTWRAGRRGLRHAWLPVPVLMVPVIMALAPAASVVVQGLLAAVAIGLSLLRAWHRPGLRRRLLPALAVLAAGALAGALTDRTDLCRPESLLQGHAVWHLLAAAALWWLAPAVGSGAPVPTGARGAVPPAESS